MNTMSADNTNSRRDDSADRVIEQCVVTQCMIDITEKQLNALRTISSTNDGITQKEICESESKLIKLFSKQLVCKSRLRKSADRDLPEELDEYPNSGQFLNIVGLEKPVVKSLLGRGITLDTLLGMRTAQVETLLTRFAANEDSVAMLNAALKNLQLWTESQLSDSAAMPPDIQLHWSSYKSASSSPYGGSSPSFSYLNMRPSTSSLPADSFTGTPLSPTSPTTPPKSTPSSPFFESSSAEHRRRLTPPSTPPLVKPSKGKFPTTPPPQKKNKLCPDAFHPLIKSRSHESQLSVKITQDNVDGPNHESLSPRKKSSDISVESPRVPSGQSSPLTSPKRSPPYKGPELSPACDIHPNKKNTLVVPASPTPVISPRSCMKHSINHSYVHRFSTKPIFGSCDLCHRHVLIGKSCKRCKFTTKMIMAECNLCHKHVFRGRVCRDCKLKYHKECAAKAAPACGLPNALVDYYINHLQSGQNPDSPSALRHHINHTVSLPPGADSSMVHAASVPAFQGQDSASTTSGSCNSSTPSSPAHFNTSPPSPGSALMMSSGSAASQEFTSFTFPEVTSDFGSLGSMEPLTSMNIKETASSITLTGPNLGSDRIDVVGTNTSNDSDKSDKTLIDTGSSGENRSSVLDRVDSTESGEDGLTWSRVNSMSIKEWDIPYEELQIEEKIGDGRFGSVYKGNWHGDVAIKMLNMDNQPTDSTSQLLAFKREIAMLRKTRHENLVLFMGACTNPQHLAIVTSLCKQQTLYHYIHVRKEKFAMNRTIIIGSQVAQGMGYLHAKGIVHKDLKSKNIFLESGKVVITDFGLFSVTKLCHGNRKGEWLNIPTGWLCYLAPEVIRGLQAFNHVDLPFSEASDVYAFGTVWYELLVGEWPFRGHHAESIIWQVGRGMKQSLGALQASKDVKEVLMSCWAYNVAKRPKYSDLLDSLDRMPRKRLARCPSHPIHLSRSAESVF